MTRPDDDSPSALITRIAGLVHRPQDAYEIANQILEDPAAAKWMPEVPSPLLHRLICEVGMGDAGELIELASADQVREVLDLELWQGDRLKLEESLDWIHFLSTLSDDVAMRHIHALDIELLGCLLLRWSRLYLLEDGNLPEEPEGAVWTSPDNWYAVEVLAHSKAQVDQVNTLLDKLYQEEPEDTRRLLQNLLWELPTELEEWSLRWRNNRLEDLGFADPHHSLILYTYLDPASVSPSERTADMALKADADPVGTAPDALTLSPGGDGSFWTRAVTALDDASERDRIAEALLSLGNRALAADRVSPDDTEAARHSLDDLRWRLSLGLEYVCGGDVARGPAALAGIALMRLARLGHSMGLDLHRALLPLQREGKLGARLGAANRLDPPLRQQVEALLRLRPRYFDAASGEARAIRTLEELGLARAWVERVGEEVAFMDQRGLPDPYPAGVTLGDLFRTRVINAALGRADQPLSLEALGQFIGDHLGGGELSAAARSQAEALAPEREALIAPWLERLQEVLGPLSPGDLDPRFIEGAWLAL